MTLIHTHWLRFQNGGWKYKMEEIEREEGESRLGFYMVRHFDLRPQDEV